MPHPNLKSGYHCIQANFPADSKTVDKLIIGRFNTDDAYHLLGYYPISASCYFSDESEANQDLGICNLPKGKSKLAELIKGDVFTLVSSSNSQKHSDIKFLSFC